MLSTRHFILNSILMSVVCCTNPQTSYGQMDKPTPPKGVHYQPDVQYGTGGDMKLHLDLARPDNADKPLPCIVVIHGGAWRAGNKAGHTNNIFDLAQQGFVAVSVQYRFCPEHRFPAQVEDVKCAVRYLRAQADKHHIDSKRIGAVGFSAGAHLAMMLATMGPDDGLEGKGGWQDQKSQVQAAVAYFGPTDFCADDIPPVSQNLLRDFIGGTKAEKPDEYRRASPITYVSKGDAPLLIFQGTEDPLVPHTQAFKMTDAMTKASVPGRVELLIGAGHGWRGKQQQRTLAETTEFFRQYLKR